MVTDGLERISEPRPRVPGKLRIYFMGLFHIRYEANLAALLRAIELVRSENPRIEISATFRCGSIRSSVIGGFRGMQVLPFGSEADVEADMKSADLLYMPLPFREEDSDFVRFSLSTKMITYLGAGFRSLPRAARGRRARTAVREQCGVHLEQPRTRVAGRGAPRGDCRPRERRCAGPGSDRTGNEALHA